MDLANSGKKPLVCASSRGLGRGVAEALADAGCALVLNGRTKETLEKTAQEICDAYEVEALTGAADVTTEDDRAKLLAEAGDVDVLATNAGRPPPGMWSDWTRDDFIKALDANMLAPIALMTALMPKMIEKGWGRLVNITSQSVKAPIPQLGLSNAASTGLNGYVAGTARQVAPYGMIVNNLLPGLHATDRAKTLDAGLAEREGITVEKATKRKKSAIPARPYGDAGDFGRLCAFLCSTHAGFIVGQNVRWMAGRQT